MGPTPASDDTPIQALRQQVAALEGRIAALERLLGVSYQGAEGTAERRPAPRAAEWNEGGGWVTHAGLSLVGLAVAYLLRAMTASGSLPVRYGVALGGAYAMGWLVWAARTPAGERVTLHLRALTAALIMGPLLWEAQLRFRALDTWQSASVLALFAGFGLAISWKKNLTAVAWVSSLAGLSLGWGLLVQTRDLLPFTATLLALALAVEASACLDHYLSERWIVALSADLAVGLMTVVAVRQTEGLLGYVPLERNAVLGAQIGLVVIYLGSAMFRTLGRGFTVQAFEIWQGAVATAGACWGAVRVAHGHPAAIKAVGIFCALSGLISYGVSFAFLERRQGMDRNFHTYATFGLALSLGASVLLLRGVLLVSAWCATAMTFLGLARRSGRSTLKLHAGAFLALSTAVSGLGTLTAACYLAPGDQATKAVLTLPMAIAAAAAVLSGVLALRGSGQVSTASRLACAAVAGNGLWALAAVGAVLAAPLEGITGEPGLHLRPALLTAVLLTLALMAGWFWRRSRRLEWKWLAWLMVGAATYKLAIQDLQQDQMFATVISLLCYGGTLILLPRVLRAPSRHSPVPTKE